MRRSVSHPLPLKEHCEKQKKPQRPCRAFARFYGILAEAARPAIDSTSAHALDEKKLVAKANSGPGSSLQAWASFLSK
jgi:hypothetical protein